MNLTWSVKLALPSRSLEQKKLSQKTLENLLFYGFRYFVLINNKTENLTQNIEHQTSNDDA